MDFRKIAKTPSAKGSTLIILSRISLFALVGLVAMTAVLYVQQAKHLFTQEQNEWVQQVTKLYADVLSADFIKIDQNIQQALSAQPTDLVQVEQSVHALFPDAFLIKTFQATDTIDELGYASQEMVKKAFAGQTVMPEVHRVNNKQVMTWVKPIQHNNEHAALYISNNLNVLQDKFKLIRIPNVKLSLEQKINGSNQEFLRTASALSPDAVSYPIPQTNWYVRGDIASFNKEARLNLWIWGGQASIILLIIGLYFSLRKRFKSSLTQDILKVDELIQQFHPVKNFKIPRFENKEFDLINWACEVAPEYSSFSAEESPISDNFQTPEKNYSEVSTPQVPEVDNEQSSSLMPEDNNEDLTMSLVKGETNNHSVEEEQSSNTHKENTSLELTQETTEEPALETTTPKPEVNVSNEIFRAYDVRGVVDQNLTEEVAYHLGRSFGSEALSQQQQTVVVGRDGRLTGERLQKQLMKGLIESGVDVIDVGMVPTPVLYFACDHLQTHTGIMITGSHNPANYNGFKMVLNGNSLAELAIQSLYDRIIYHNYNDGQGKITQKEIIDDYISAVKSSIKLDKKLKVVVDCGNGVVGCLAEKLFTELGVEFYGLFCEVDGEFPNHHPDPGQPGNLLDLIHEVQNQNADLGLAFDGDGDRLGIVTGAGEIIWPDKLMMLFVKQVLSEQPEASIIYDVKCTHHLGKYIEENGGVPVMFKTGHSLIKRKMKELESPLAGEMSGHFFFKHRWYGFDDGCYSACRLLELIANDPENLSLEQKLETLPQTVNTPEINIALADDQKFAFIERLKQIVDFKNANIITVDGLRVEFDKGWGLVRASNTTPNLVLRFEADTKEALEEIQTEFKTLMSKVNPEMDFPF